jgi:hypothetical protein
MNSINFLRLEKILVIFLFILGGYLCFIGGYGSDEDTLPMFGVFKSLLESGKLMTSRFTGYPVAEIGLGFIAYNFGSFYANLVTYTFFILAIYIIFLTLNDFKKDNLFLFLLLCLSNQFLFFDNLEPIDYSWALFFFSLGLYFYKKNILELSILFFAITIGARLNFGLFIVVAILFFDSENHKKLFTKLRIIFVILFLGCLFYVPVWYQNSLNFEWLTASRPTSQGVLGIFARFFYKITLAFNFLSLLLIILIFITYKKNIKLNNVNNNFIFSIILSNLALFLWIPAEISYIQPAIIFLYFFIANNFKKNLVYIIIFSNFIYWIVNFNFLKIEYKDYVDECSPIEAISAKVSFDISDGAYQNFINTRKKIKCWVNNPDSDYGKKIIQGKPLK